MGAPLSFDPEIAHDPDPDDTLTFAMSKSGNEVPYIIVNQTSGELLVKEDYDIDELGRSNNISLELKVGATSNFY